MRPIELRKFSALAIRAGRSATSVDIEVPTARYYRGTIGTLALVTFGTAKTDQHWRIFNAVRCHAAPVKNSLKRSNRGLRTIIYTH